MKPHYFACTKGFIDVVKYLVEYGADINKETKDGISPLSIACSNGDQEIIKYLVEHGANINNYGITPLFATCGKGDRKSVV